MFTTRGSSSSHLETLGAEKKMRRESGERREGKKGRCGLHTATLTAVGNLGLNSGLLTNSVTFA